MQKDNKIVGILKYILYNLKWIGIVVLVAYGFLFLEAATDAYGIENSEEYIMYTFLGGLAIVIALSVYHKKWIMYCDKVIKKINNKFEK